MENLDDVFPRYREFDPAVPVWCLTPDLKGCIHRFFDTSPLSPSGKYLAVFRLPFEDRQPGPGEEGDIIIIDLSSGKYHVAARTRGWEPQMGANINWGGTDRELFFNDVDPADWDPFSWKLDFMSGDKKKMEGPVYHASPDGKWLISANMASMRRTQPGYGVVVPEEKIPRNIGPADDDGFYLTDTSTGKCRMFFSVKELLSRAQPPVRIEDAGSQEIYGFHSKFNPRGDMLMLSLRWFPAGDNPRLNMFKLDKKAVRYAWLAAGLSGQPLHCSAGPEVWIKSGHHATWFPDGKKISMNLNIDGDGMRFVKVNSDGSELSKMHGSIYGSGHPTVYPGERYILTDAYLHENLAFPDGTVPLRWIDLKEGKETAIIRINVRQPHRESVLRVDPHPAWDRSWRYAVFNGFSEGTRKVFIADMQGLVP